MAVSEIAGGPQTQLARHRVAGWCGIVFLPVFVFGLLFALDSPDTGDSDAKWVSWYSDSSHRVEVLIGAYLLIISALLFLAFAAGLRDSLALVSPSGRWFVTAAAVVFAGLVMVGAINVVGVAGNIEFGDAPVPKDADVLRQNFGYPFIFVAGALTAAALIASASYFGRQIGLFPTWFSVLGYIFAVILLVAVIFFPMAAVPIWVLIASIFLLRRRAVLRPAHASAAL